MGSVSLQVQRKAGNELQSRLEGLDAKQADYGDTLLTVDRLWQELNHDIRFLAQRACQAQVSPAALLRHPRVTRGDIPTSHLRIPFAKALDCIPSQASTPGGRGGGGF